MRKWYVLAVVLIVFLTCFGAAAEEIDSSTYDDAAAEEIDFSAYDDDALVALYLRIQQELTDRNIDTSAIQATESDASGPEDAATSEEPVIMQKGSRGDDVKVLQENLIALGYLTGSADGAFGDKTTAAVIAYQKGNGLPEDGLVTQTLFDKIQQSVDSMPEKPKTFTAVDLYNLFNQNKVSAEAELSGKTIIVTGKIYSIDSSIWGDYYVKLYADSWGFSGVYCYFYDEMKAELANLKKDQKVTIKGICNGSGLLGDPEMTDCEFIG